MTRTADLPTEATLRALRTAWQLPELPAEALGGAESRINISLRMGDWVFQRINRSVFPDPERVVNNVVQVCQHLQQHVAHGSYHEQVLQPIASRDGSHAVLIDGEIWRATRYIANGSNHGSVGSDKVAFEGARAVAAFLLALRDFAPRHYQPALPGFHQLSNRITALQDAVQRNAMGRVAEAAPWLTRAEASLHYLTSLEQQVVSGVLPARFVHGDTKIGNVLFDRSGRKAIAVLDLDTVMVSSLVFDFADMARSYCNPAGENAEPEAVSVSVSRFEAMTKGFLSILDRELLRQERDALLPATLAITLTLGIRFLTDHLNGDHYFKIDRPGDNLRRAAVQIALVDAFLRERKALLRCLKV